MSKQAFTKRQLEDWQAYERVRQSGRFNMFDPRARLATGLSLRDYGFAMDNYERLHDAATQATGNSGGEKV